MNAVRSGCTASVPASWPLPCAKGSRAPSRMRTPSVLAPDDPGPFPGLRKGSFPDGVQDFDMKLADPFFPRRCGVPQSRLSALHVEGCLQATLIAPDAQAENRPVTQDAVNRDQVDLVRGEWFSGTTSCA